MALNGFLDAKDDVKQMKQKQQAAKSDMIEIDQKLSEVEEKLKEINSVCKQWKSKVNCN